MTTTLAALSLLLAAHAAPPAAPAASPSIAQRLATAKTAFRYDVSLVDGAAGDDDPLHADDVSVDRWYLAARGQAKGEHLGFGLTRYHYPAGDEAAAALKRYLDTADPNTGHTYAWDFALVDRANDDVWLIDAPCLYSHENFVALAHALRQLTGATDGDAVICTCGGGCDAISPSSGR